MAELTLEGPEAFKKMYRMEYSTFIKLCDIISLKILVNDEMSRHRTGKDAITIEIMFLLSVEMVRWRQLY